MCMKVIDLKNSFLYSLSCSEFFYHLNNYGCFYDHFLLLLYISFSHYDFKELIFGDFSDFIYS